MPTEPMHCISCQMEFHAFGSRNGLCRHCNARRARMWIAGGIAVAIVGLVSILVITQVINKRRPDEQRELERIAKRLEEARAMEPAPVLDRNAPTRGELLAIENCDANSMRSIVKAYNHEDKHEAAIRAGTAYTAKCKRAALLDWDILYAHEQLEQWDKAEPITDRLLKEDPSDTDFWWWRGKVRRHRGKNEAAIVDLRQSMTQADDSSNGVQIDHLDEAGKPINQRCETAFGLRLLANAGVDLVDSATQQFNEIVLENNCRKLDGKGELVYGSGMKRTRVAGKLAGKKVNMLVDGGIGTTLVRRDIADAAKLERGVEVEVMTPTGLGTGVISTADVVAGGATAPTVPVVIVDSLPEGIDVVVGLSFLWRFDLEKIETDKHRARTPKLD